MTYKNYSKNELKTLLQQTQQEVISKLLNPFDQNNQYYYENFASITIKIFKYVNHFLNQINSDQDFGKLIDSIIKNLAESLNEYKSRNIFMHSTYTQESENRNQDDEIYHFMNTRNNNIPAQCLNNYESQKQRIELQQFVQEMSKHTKYNFKQQKRSLMLPNENSSKLKLGRKATFDTELRSIKQQKIESKTFLSFQEHQKQEQITRNHIQIQTDFTIIQEEYKKTKTLEAYTQCQCESLPIFQKASQSLPNRKELIWNKKKKQPKKDLKGKKKVKTTNNPSSISLKEPIQDFNEYQKQYKQQYPSKIQCTIKDVNLILNITKEVDLTVFDCQINDIFQYQNSPVTPSVDENYINNENNMFLNDQFSQNIEEMVIRYQKTIQSQKDDEQQYKTQTHQNLSQDQQIQKQINLLQQNNKKTSVQITQRQVQQQKIKSKIYYDEIKISNNDDISKKISKEHTQNRRIPSPTVKIVEAYQIQKKAQFNQQNFPSKHNQITRNQNKISKKKKIFTSSLNFHTSIQTIQNESQKSKDIHSIKKSNFNTDEASKIYKNRKESNKQNHKYSILAKNSISNISEIPSQQYLISRQKSAQIKLNNPNLDIFKNQIKDQQPKNRLEKETNNKQQIVKSKTSNNSKLSGYISRLNQNQHQIVNNSLMIFFSKKPKILHLNQTQPRIQSLIHGQNDRSSSSFYRQNLLSHKGKQSNRKNGFNSVDEICKTPQKFNIYERNIINLKKYREKECKTVDPATASPKRSIFHHNSSAITPIKTAMSKLRQEARQVNTSQSHHKNFIYSKSQHQDSQNFEFDELKRKLRNRTNKDKLSHYLELIQATHIKFCGNNCEHITQLLKEKDGQVSQQILRLFKRIK